MADDTPWYEQKEIHSGFLTKRGNMLKTWKKRYFVLIATQLVYVKNANDIKAQGAIGLSRECEVRLSLEPFMEKTSGEGFELVTPDRTYYLVADTRDERDLWLAKLDETLKVIPTARPLGKTIESEDELDVKSEDSQPLPPTAASATSPKGRRGKKMPAPPSASAASHGSRRDKKLPADPEVKSNNTSGSGTTSASGGTSSNGGASGGGGGGFLSRFRKKEEDPMVAGKVTEFPAAGEVRKGNGGSGRSGGDRGGGGGSESLGRRPIGVTGGADSAGRRRQGDDGISAPMQFKKSSSRREAKPPPPEPSPARSKAADAGSARTKAPRFPVKEGFLTKQGGFVKHWQSRWFILRDGSVSYYRTKQDSSPAGEFSLAGAKLYKIADSRFGKKYCFEIATPKRSYYLLADNEDHREEWLRAIKLSIDLADKLHMAPERKGLGKMFGDAFKVDSSAMFGTTNFPKQPQSERVDTVPGGGGSGSKHAPAGGSGSKHAAGSRGSRRGAPAIQAKKFESSLREGYLEIVTRFTKSWKKQFVTLDRRALLYFTRPEDAAPQGDIPADQLRQATIAPTDQHAPDRPYAFLVETPDRAFTFSASSAKERDSWIRCLEKVSKG